MTDEDLAKLKEIAKELPDWDEILECLVKGKESWMLTERCN